MFRNQALYATLSNPKTFFHDFTPVCLDYFMYAASCSENRNFCLIFYQIFTSVQPIPLLTRAHATLDLLVDHFLL